MNNIFKEAIQINAPQKSKFDLSHERKLSCDMARLVPIMCQEILPGDSVHLNTEIMVRLAPLLAPLYHRLDVYTHYFFVPNRIIWNEWATFITGGDDGLQAPVHPTMGDIARSDIWEAPGGPGSLVDYMGLPVGGAGNLSGINALPFRAYAEIFNEYYRDENLVQKIAYSKGSGVHDAAETLRLATILSRAWEKDYFTTALPFAQKGNPAGAPVDYLAQPSVVKYSADGQLRGATPLGTNAQSELSESVPVNQLRIEAAASVLITELRKAARLQEFLEASARGGSRLTEWVLHVFGVRSSDARLQRPEYLGGGKTPVTISEVLSTYDGIDAGNNLPQGHFTGHGIAVGSEHGFSRSFEEHGFVIGIMSVMPKANYYQGLSRQWTRPTRFDYYIPQFAHLGEQEVRNREVFLSGVPATDDATFGYQSRYAEYKFNQSTIHGSFRDSLAYWHMARKFDATPGLNEQFITCSPRKDIFPVVSESDHPLFVQVYHDMSAIRPLPYFSNPKL